VLEPVADTVMLAGSVSVGGVLSATVTAKLADPVPFASVAVQCTNVTPRAKVEPLAGVQFGAKASCLSHPSRSR
jgi:hypothetical protein